MTQRKGNQRGRGGWPGCTWLAVALLGLGGCGADASSGDATTTDATTTDAATVDAATADAATDAANLDATYAAQRAAILADPFLDIAHRGGRKLWPEHTTIAYDGASKLGVDMIEFDVHASSDGVIVVMHDATLELTTNG